jgi:hypothetical protein
MSCTVVDDEGMLMSHETCKTIVVAFYGKKSES